MTAVTPSDAKPARFTRRKVGLIITALPVLFLVFDTVIKLAKLDIVVESFGQLGYDPSLAVGIGLLQLACLVLFLIPRTSVLGAILLTGFLGGAIASQLRAGNPLFSHVIFPLYIAVPLWVGLLLREERLRALLPLRK